MSSISKGKSGTEKCWLCTRTQAEVDSLKIKQSGLNFPEGYTIDFPSSSKRVSRSNRRYPDLYQTVRLWLCPVCAQIVFDVKLPPER